MTGSPGRAAAPPASWPARLRRSLGRPRGSDVVAGLVTGLFSIPEGMAYASIAGFGPVQGIYAGALPTMVGALFARTVLMVTTLTSAIALTSQSVLSAAGLDPSDMRAVATLTLLTGLVMLLLGVLRLGVLLSFVSNAVMTGFSTGIALQIVTGVLGDATGYDPAGHNKLVQLGDWLVHVPSWHWPTVLVAAATVAVWALVRLARPLRATATLIALVVVSVAVAVAGTDVELVGDIAAIPTGLPALSVPDLSLVPALLGGAVSVALVALAQAAGIGAAVPNPDGSRGDTDRDFTAQGLANAAGSLVQALPVGGSLSRTGVAVSAGARTRWSGIFAGAWLALVILTVGRLAEYIPMAVIGGLIMVIGAELVIGRFGDIVLVARTSKTSLAALVVTFLATTQLPLQRAIVFGAVLSLLLYCAQVARRGALTALARGPRGMWSQTDVPDTVPSGEVTVLQYDGVGFFAELPWLRRRWPEVRGTRRAVVVLRLRGAPDVPSSALLKALAEYAERLRSQGCRLFIVGVPPRYAAVLKATGLLDAFGEDAVYPEGPEYFGALTRAVADGRALIASGALDAPDASRPRG